MFPPRKGHFLFIFECLPLFLLSLFWASPLFNCFFSVFFLFFLPSCLCFFVLFCFFVFVMFFPFLFSLLLFHEKNNIKLFNYNVFFWGGGFCLVFSLEIPLKFFLSLFFS